MIKKIRLALQLLGNMGFRYTAFRVLFELQKKSGVFKKRFPVHPAMKEFISLQEWKAKTVFLIQEQATWKNYPFAVDQSKTEKMRQGIFECFSSIEYNLGVTYNWITNPDTGFQYDIQKHWSEINDYDSTSGDIKFVWEKSRFSFLYALIREDIAHGTDNAEFVFSEIQSWLKANPINQGPNYKCSQETSLRIINWTFALHFYRNSSHLTETLFQEIMHSIYWQIKHVRSNIHFSRIAVRNNHAVSETLMLYIGGLIYPFFPESAEWKRKGKKWFEQEIAYQVYPDGTFLQFSMNYHRVLIQLFNLAFLVADKHGEKFSGLVYERAYKSLNFLFQCQAQQNGYLPNYGANDGALFFPLTNCEYRDYRPSLNTLHLLLTGQHLYEQGPWYEESRFYGIQNQVAAFPVLQQQQGWITFNDGGYYLLRENASFTFIRCGQQKDRPSQADNHHLDIWVNGENILPDGGTYKYNTDTKWLKYFMGTESHNTIMLDDQDQMLKGGRFIWYYWTRKIASTTGEDTESYHFTGRICSFRHLGKRIVHTRNIIKSKGENKWRIIDQVQHKLIDRTIRQLFHVNQNSTYRLTFQAQPDIVQEGWYSGKYGQMEPIEQVEFHTVNSEIETQFTIS